MITGMDVIVVQDRHVEYPNMQLGPRVCEVLTPAMIADHNAWMREFFGTHTKLENLIKDGDEVLFIGNKAHMNPRTFAVIAGNRGR